MLPFLARNYRKLVCLALLLIATAGLVLGIERLVRLNETASAGWFYTDTRAANAFLVFCSSIAFWSMFLLPNALINWQKEHLGKIAKSIDLVWYPMGVIAAILAVASSENLVVNSKITQQRALISSQLATQDLAFLKAKEACATHRRIRESLTGRLRFLGNPEDGQSGRSIIKHRDIELFCRTGNLNIEAASSIKTLFDEFEFPSQTPKIIRTYLGPCERLFKFRTTWDFIGFDGAVDYLTAVDKDLEDATYLFYSLHDYCAYVASVQKARVLIQNYQGHLDSRDLAFRNPWIWICLLCFFAGLKLTKSLIELSLLRIEPKQKARKR